MEEGSDMNSDRYTYYNEEGDWQVRIDYPPEKEDENLVTHSDIVAVAKLVSRNIIMGYFILTRSRVL